MAADHEKGAAGGEHAESLRPRAGCWYPASTSWTALVVLCRGDGSSAIINGMRLVDLSHVVEHLTGLAALPTSGARFTTAPPTVRGLATFPVRAFTAVP